MTKGQFLAGSLFFFFMYESYTSWKIARGIQAPDLDQGLQEDVQDVEEYIVHRPSSITEVKNDRWARNRLEEILQKTKKGIVFTKATELMAQLLAEHGETAQAYEMLKGEKERLSPNAYCFLQLLAYRLELWEDVVAIGDRAYQGLPNYHCALTNAIAYAMLKKPKQSVGWLKCALNEGLPDLKRILGLNEFDGIREDPIFKQFVELETKR
jgi:hypothetical protein